MFFKKHSKKKEEALEALDYLESKISALNIFYGEDIKQQDLSTLQFSYEWGEFFPNFEGKCIDVPSLNGTILIVSAKKGENFPFHFHEESEWVYVLQGEIFVTVKTKMGNVSQKISRGESIGFKSMQPHLVEMTTDVVYIVQWYPALNMMQR